MGARIYGLRRSSRTNVSSVDSLSRGRASRSRRSSLERTRSPFRPPSDRISRPLSSVGSRVPSRVTSTIGSLTRTKCARRGRARPASSPVSRAVRMRRNERGSIRPRPRIESQHPTSARATRRRCPDAPRLRSPARSARAKSRLADLRDRFSRHETVASTRVAGRACCGGRSTWMCAPTHSSSARPPAPAGGTHPSTVEASARRIGLATVLIGRIVGIDSAVVTHPSRAGASPVVPSRGSSARSTRAPRRPRSARALDLTLAGGVAMTRLPCLRIADSARKCPKWRRTALSRSGTLLASRLVCTSS